MENRKYIHRIAIKKIPKGNSIVKINKQKRKRKAHEVAGEMYDEINV